MDAYMEKALSMMGLNNTPLSDKEVFDIVLRLHPDLSVDSLGELFYSTKQAIAEANNRMWRNVLQNPTFMNNAHSLAGKLRTLDMRSATSVPTLVPHTDPRPTGQGVLEAGAPIMAEDGSAGDLIQCMVCGGFYKMLTKAHLRHHGLTPEEYKARYGIDKKIRLVAPSLSEHRRIAAQKSQLWKKSPTGSLGLAKDQVQEPESVDTAQNSPPPVSSHVAEQEPEIRQ